VDRRSFLGTGAASLVAAATPTGAAAAAAAASTPGDVLVVPDSPAGLDEYLAGVDTRMSALESWSLTEQFGVAPPDAAQVDALGRGILRSMYFTGMIGDLPTDLQVQPQVQRRIEAIAPVMDDAIEGTLEYLRSRGPAELERVQHVLRTTDAGSRIIEGFDRVAGRNAVSERRRRHTRLLLRDVEWRLRLQPPATVVGEYVDKVERLTATDIAAEARLQDLAALVGAEVVRQRSEPSKRERRIRRGLKVMGFGVATFVVGALIVQSSSDSTESPGLFVGTVGAVTFIVGLLILLVGALTPPGS
jgi:hypothetical protein